MYNIYITDNIIPTKEELLRLTPHKTSTDALINKNVGQTITEMQKLYSIYQPFIRSTHVSDTDKIITIDFGHYTKFIAYMPIKKEKIKWVIGLKQTSL